MDSRTVAAGSRFGRPPATLVRFMADLGAEEGARVRERLSTVPGIDRAADGEIADIVAAAACALADAAGDRSPSCSVVRDRAGWTAVFVHGMTAIIAEAALGAIALVERARGDGWHPKAFETTLQALRGRASVRDVRELLVAAARRGLSPRPGQPGTGVLIGEGARLGRVLGTIGDGMPFAAFELCRSRMRVGQLLDAHGLPMRRQTVASSPRAAVEAAAEMDGPVVLRSLTPDARPDSPVAQGLPAIHAAFDDVAGPRGAAIVAEALSGARWRLLVARGQLVAIARVAADGALTASPDAVDPGHQRLAERAARVVGADIAAVDLIVHDIARPPAETFVRIDDVRAGPGVEPFFALAVSPPALADRLLDVLAAGAGTGRIPLVGTLDGGVADALAARWSAAGLTVGLATAQGLQVGGVRLQDGDRRGRHGLPLLVDHRSVEAAVVEIDPADLWENGLGHGRLDVAVLDAAAHPALAATLAALADRAVVAPPAVPPAAGAPRWIAVADRAAAVAAAAEWAVP
ncbi:MAG: hypothetical protein AB7P02_22795 [Alphaproteobacteria bacterium]